MSFAGKMLLLYSGTIDTVLNNTLSSLFNTTYNKNGTTGAVVETVYNLLQVTTRHLNQLLELLDLNVFRATPSGPSCCHWWWLGPS